MSAKIIKYEYCGECPIGEDDYMMDRKCSCEYTEETYCTLGFAYEPGPNCVYLK